MSDAPRPRSMSPTSKPRRPSLSRRRKSPMPPHQGGSAADPESRSESRKTKFRFKKKSRHHSRQDADEAFNRRSKRPRSSYHAPFFDDPTEYDDTYIPNVASWRQAEDQDAAFRESLFDAMADDEGAAFWEGVYGQPIHVYERPRGLLETMNDEEYAIYVRQQMWKRSQQHILEERERMLNELEECRRKAAEAKQAWEEEEREYRKRERRSTDERKIRDARKRWHRYGALWQEQLKAGDAESIPWPVLSGRVEDVTPDLVREFMLCSPRENEQQLLELLKTERVRWHPDKAQQRWGKSNGLNQAGMKAVTTVFQTVDALWTACKEQGARRRSV